MSRKTELFHFRKVPQKTSDRSPILELRSEIQFPLFLDWKPGLIFKTKSGYPVFSTILFKQIGCFEIFRAVKCLWTVFWIGILTVNATAAEMRGIWVDAFGPGFKTRREVKQLIADCREYNFNAVFVQMRKRGDAYYFPKTPNTDPRATDIAADYDALAEIIKECHNGQPRIEVHCWAVAYFVWAFDKPPPRQDHVFNKRHDLLSRDSLG